MNRFQMIFHFTAVRLSSLELLILFLPFHFTLSDVLLSENETQREHRQTGTHWCNKTKFHKMEIHLLLYYSSDACSNCTSALISHLHFPSILTPLGLKLLVNPPMPLHPKTPSVTQTKIWVKPNLHLLTQTRR